MAPTLVAIDGFEHQTVSNLKFGGGNYTGLYDFAPASSDRSFVAGRTGGWALRVASGTAESRVSIFTPATGGAVVQSLYLRFSGLPTAEALIGDTGHGASGMQFRITTGGQLKPQIGGTAGSASGPVVADGNWHLLDYRFETSTTTWAIRWTVDGIAQTDYTLGGQTADSSSDYQCSWGHYPATSALGVTTDYDDWVISMTSADYPIGPHKVFAFIPDSDGTSVPGTNVIENNIGTDATAGVAWGPMADLPPTSTDYLQQVATGSGNYAEVNFPDTTETIVWGVRALAALFSSGTTANNGTARIVDSGGTTLADIYNGDMSETVLHYRGVTVPPPGSSLGLIWSTSAVNQMKARVGFSTNVATQPRWASLSVHVAVPEVKPDLIRVEGFEHQTISALSFGATDGAGLFDSITSPTSFTIDTVVERSGAACLKVIQANGVNNLLYVGFDGTTSILVGSLYIRATAAPAAQSRIFQGVGPTNSRKLFIETSGNISAGDNTQQVGPSVIDGRWHLIDFRFDATGTTHTIDWTVDGVAQTQHTDSGQTAGLIDNLAIGNSNTTSVATYWVDDIVLSGTSTDYPIGPHKVLATVPNADGTHVAGTNVIEVEGGTDLTSGQAFGRLDEWPANTSDYIQQVASSTTNYADVNFADTLQTSIWKVEAMFAGFASATTTDANGNTKMVDSAGVSLGDIMYGDMSETTLHYRRKAVSIPGTGAAWTQAKVNGLKMQIGRASSVVSQPRWSALMLQYAVPESPTIQIADGFEHQTLSTLQFGGSQSGIYDLVQGTIPGDRSFIAGRWGGTAIRCVASANDARVQHNVASAGHSVQSFYFRWAGTPTSNYDMCDFGKASTGCWFETNTSGNIKAGVATGTLVTSTMTVNDGQWHLLDFDFDTTLNPWRLRWKVDGVEQTDATGVVAADTTSAVLSRMCHGTGNPGTTIDYDDWVLSQTPGDYPIGPHRVLSAVPNADGTHALSTQVVDESSGTTNLYTHIDEWPANTSDYIKQQGNNANAYAEVAFPDTTDPYVWGVWAIMAGFAENATANHGIASVYDSTGTFLVSIYNGDMSETVLHYRTALVPPPLTPAKFNGLTVRMGFSTNAATDAYWSALMLQYAVPFEAVTAAVPITANDSAIGADTSALATDLGVTDVAAGADVVTVLVVAVTDAAVGADASTTLTAAIPATDTAVGADTSSLAAALATVTDSATGADISSVQSGASVSAFDTAAAVDTLTAAARVVTETGSSTDTSSVLAGNSVAASDSASASDTATVFTGLIEGFEGAAFPFDVFQTAPALPQPADITNGLPALTQAVTATTNIGVFASDAAVAIEVTSGRAAAVIDSATVADVAPALAKPGTDSATSTDVVATRSSAVTDAATSADVSALAAVLATRTDTGSVVDSVPTLARGVTDAASVVDAADLTNGIITPDTAEVDDSVTALDADLVVSDSATVADAAVMTNVPQNLIAVAISTNEIDLTWDVFAGAVAYDIERDGAIIAFDVPTNAYDDTGLNPDTLYTYRVRAVV